MKILHSVMFVSLCITTPIALAQSDTRTYDENSESIPTSKWDELINPSKWKLSGYIMLDHDMFSDVYLEQVSADNDSDYFNNTEIRRARLSLKYRHNADWSGKLQYDFSDGTPELKDAYLKYKGWKNLENRPYNLSLPSITLGRHKEPFGLENQTSSGDLMFVERSLLSSALSPGRSTGISANTKFQYGTFDIGYFNDSLDSLSSSNTNPNANTFTALTGRLTIKPFKTKNTRLQFGGSFSQRTLSGQATRINESLELSGADSIIEGDWINADKSELGGLELLAQYKAFNLMSEWQHATFTDTTTDYSLAYQGAYTQASYLFGGQRKTKGSDLATPNITGELGALEFSYRLSEFELESEDQSTKTQSLGLAYYPNKQLKIMATYSEAQLFSDGQQENEGDALSLRLQLRF